MSVRKARAKKQKELGYVIRTLFLRQDLDKLLVILKEQRIWKVLDWVSFSALDLENLSYTSTNKETLKLDYYEIDLVVVFKAFIKAQKLGLMSNFYYITFKDFNVFG